MHEMGIPKKLITITKICTNNSINKIRISGDESSPFQVETGVKQGDGLSPLLFNITLEKVIQDLWQDREMVCKLLAYADDIALIGNNQSEIEEYFKIIEERAHQVGLVINQEKTKYMIIQKNEINHTSRTVNINNKEFEVVSNFKYLGININERNQIEHEINARLNNANRSFYSMHKILKSKSVTQNTKVKIYRSIIQPVVLYAAETWPLKTNIIQRVQSFENKVLRKIYGPTFDTQLNLWRIKKNRELYALYKHPIISNIIKSKILQWAGHVARADDSSNIKRSLLLEYHEPRAVGRPRKKWEDGVRSIMHSINPERENDWQYTATDRFQWRRLVAEAKDPRGLDS